MPKYWMISNRNKKNDGLGGDRAPITFWTSNGGNLDQINNWTKVTPDSFRKSVVEVADGFPLIEDPDNFENQKHVTLFIHGYNNDWADAARRYQSLCDRMFLGDKGLGICILFSWPSDGMRLGYLPDRIEARNCAQDFTEILVEFYDWLVRKQEIGARDSSKACRAKTSIIAHSMGNYLLQKAMQLAWTRKNQPLLVSLVNQLLMVAADVDNDLFGAGESNDKGDGDAIANLTYRVTALYTGRDPVLGLSAGFKHFGKRRLGRTGLDRSRPLPDNVWEYDCSALFGKDQKNIHSAYFEEQKTLDLMTRILKGVDRGLLP